VTLIAYRCAKQNSIIPEVKKQVQCVLLLLFISSINLFIFGLIFNFRVNNDTDSFILTIERFRGLDRPLHPNRYLNPLYPLVGATILRWANPAQVLILLNCGFYFGLVLITYGLIRRVFNNRAVGFISALLIMTSYAIIRYGLTQVQDIGGYFWFLLTLYSGWRWYIEKKNTWLYIGGMAVALGMLTKESGAMAAPFVGILMLVSSISIPDKLKAFVKFSVIPFIVLCINQYRGRLMGYSSGDWFVWNWKIFSKDFTLVKWLGVNLTTYNVVWLLAGWGLFVMIKNWSKISREIKIFLCAVLPSSLSYFSWPIFLSRTVFIAAWFLVPLAAYGIYDIYSKKRWLGQSLVVFAIVLPYLLQALLGYTPVFLILQDKCRYNIQCSWDVFVHKRGNFDDFRLHSDRFLE
jgi:4-amino-4-deoxy-L-arabinose transferase-like glycosyltransferase